MRMKKSLHVRGSSHRGTLSAVSLLLLGAGGLLLPIGQANAAERCSNVTYHLEYPDKINLVGKKIGDTIGNITTTFTGSCLKGVFTGGYVISVSSTLGYPDPGGQGPLGTGGYKVFDPTGSFSIQSGSFGNNTIRLTYAGMTASGWMDIKGSRVWPMILEKKIPGKTSIPIGQMYTNQGFYLIDWGVAFPLTNVIGTGNFGGSIELTYTPTCSASVNDVTFPGTPTPSAIAAGTVTPQTATVSVTCDDILPKYTVKVSSPNGTQGGATDGVIKSNNPTVGYRLSWKEGQVANAGSNIQLDSVLTPATLPTQSTFTLPISVKPVALVPQGSITAGPANSAVKIDLTFN